MNKSEFFKKILQSTSSIPKKIIKKSVKDILEYMIISLTQKKRIEIRGFGSFSLRYRVSRKMQNPKNGEIINLKARYVPYFKPGKELKNKVNI